MSHSTRLGLALVAALVSRGASVMWSRSRPSSRAVVAVAVLLAVLVACGVPVPQDKQHYVGQWDGEAVSLRITAEGWVDYERQAGTGQVSINAPILAFEGDDFLVGVPLLSTTFAVQRPPWLENDRWHMVLDGIELVRAGDPFAGQRAEVAERTIEILDIGVFGHERADGTRALVSSTARVPAAVGRSFGASFALHEPGDTSVVLSFHWEHPPIRDSSTGAVQTEMLFHSATSPGGPHWVSADLHVPDDLVPGAWTLTISDPERQLARQRFQLYLPEPAAPRR